MIMIGMQKYPLVRLSANMVFTLSHIFRGLRTLARDLLCQWQAANHMMAPVKLNKCDANEAGGGRVKHATTLLSPADVSRTLNHRPGWEPRV